MQTRHKISIVCCSILIFISNGSHSAINDAQEGNTSGAKSFIDEGVDALRYYSDNFLSTTNCAPPHQCSPLPSLFKNSPIKNDANFFEAGRQESRWSDILDSIGLELYFFVSPNSDSSSQTIGIRRPDKGNNENN